MSNHLAEIKRLEARLEAAEKYNVEDAKTMRRQERTIRFLRDHVQILQQYVANLRDNADTGLSAMDEILAELTNLRRTISLNDMLMRLKRINPVAYANYANSHAPEMRMVANHHRRRNGISHIFVTYFPDTADECMSAIQNDITRWNAARDNDKERMIALLRNLRLQTYSPTSDYPTYIRVASDIFAAIYPTYRTIPSTDIQNEIARLLDPVAVLGLPPTISTRLAALRATLHQRPRSPRPMTPDSD